MKFTIGARVYVGKDRLLSTIVAWPDIAIGPNVLNRVAVVMDGFAGVTTHEKYEIWTKEVGFVRETIFQLNGSFSVKNVLDALGEEFTRNNVDQILHRMVEEKELVRVSRGVYQNI